MKMIAIFWLYIEGYQLDVRFFHPKITYGGTQRLFSVKYMFGEVNIG